MRVSLTPGELADMLAGMLRDETGTVWLDIPDACIQRDSPRLVLSHPQIVRYDDRHTRLTSIQYALVRFIDSHGPADFDEVKESVWLKNVSDKRVANTCSEISATLSDAGIPVEVSSEGSMISIREI